MLQTRVRGRRQLPCVHSCTNWAGSQCRKAGGHQCSLDTTAIDGGALEYDARTEATWIDSIDERLARAIGRSWREEWGAQLSLDELMQHGLCRHAKYQFSKDLSSEEEEPMDEPAALTVPVGLPTDTLCQKCNWTRKTLEDNHLTWDDGNAFQHVGDEFWVCKWPGHLKAVKRAHQRKYGTATARSSSAITQGSAITRATAAAMDDGIAQVRKSIDKMRGRRKSLSASANATEARRNSAARLLLDTTDKITQGNRERGCCAAARSLRVTHDQPRSTYR
eukprot:COSAG02_NODE_9055_length_2346_cov_12.600356_2_plen_278_part_00